jgi:hypothetical protein
MTNHLGKNLDIVINAKYDYYGDWTAFASWYSLTKMLPDAKISLFLEFDGKKNQVFNWVNKVGLTLSIKKSNFLEIDSSVVAIRELDNKAVNYLNLGSKDIKPLCCLAKSDNFLPFASYHEGCGSFVASEWINKIECPFPLADRFMTYNVTSNEIKVLKLWKQISNLYATVSRS